MELRMRWTMQVCTIVGGKHGGDSLRKSLQAIDDGNQNVLDAAVVLEFGHDAQPEFSAFRGLDPKAQDVLGSFRRDAKRDIVTALLRTSPSSRILTRRASKKNQRIHRFQRPVRCHSATVSRTASVTVEMRSGETSRP